MRADEAEYEREEGKVRLQQFHRGQLRYQSALSCVQSEIEALSTTLVQDRKYLEFRLVHSNKQTFSGFVKKRVEDGRQVRLKIHEEPFKTVDVYADGWQSCSNALRNAVADVATAVGAVRAAFGFPPVLAPEA